MATIKIIDAVGAIIDVDVREGSSLDEYVSSLPGLIFKGRFDEIFPLPLNELDDSIEGGEIGFEFDAPVKLDVEGVAMTVGGGASLSIDIRTPEDGSLFESDYYDTDIPIDAGHRYLGLGFTARASVTGEAAGGERTFGIDAEGAIGFRNFRRYGEGDGFGEALKETLSSFVIPAKVDDLGELPSGVVATAEGRGTLKLSVEAELLTVTNPLASLAIPALTSDGRIQLRWKALNAEAHRELVAVTRRLLRKVGFWYVLPISLGVVNTLQNSGYHPRTTRFHKLQ